MTEQHLLARWRAGKLTLVEEQEARGRVAACREASTMSLEAMQRFYEQALHEVQK